MPSLLFGDIADIILFILSNLQREFPKFFTFRARDKVGVKHTYKIIMDKSCP